MLPFLLDEGVQRSSGLSLGRRFETIGCDLTNQDKFLLGLYHRDLISIHRESVVCVVLWPFVYRPKMGIVKNRKFGVRSKIFCFLKVCRIMGINQWTFV